MIGDLSLYFQYINLKTISQYGWAHDVFHVVARHSKLEPEMGMNRTKMALWSLLILAITSTPAIGQDEKKNLVGKQFEFDYGDYAYAITIVSESELNWELTKGDYPGPKNGNETYYLSEVTDEITFISWVEASGLGVYNVLNFSSSELYTHAREKESTFVNIGKIVELE